MDHPNRMACIFYWLHFRWLENVEYISQRSKTRILFPQNFQKSEKKGNFELNVKILLYSNSSLSVYMYKVQHEMRISILIILWKTIKNRGDRRSTCEMRLQSSSSLFDIRFPQKRGTFSISSRPFRLCQWWRKLDIFAIFRRIGQASRRKIDVTFHKNQKWIWNRAQKIKKEKRAIKKRKRKVQKRSESEFASPQTVTILCVMQDEKYRRKSPTVSDVSTETEEEPRPYTETQRKFFSQHEPSKRRKE